MDARAQWRALVTAMRSQEERVRQELDKLERAVREDVVVAVLLEALGREGRAVAAVEAAVEAHLPDDGTASMSSTVAMDQYWRHAQRVVQLQGALLRELLHVADRRKQVLSMEPDGLASLYETSTEARGVREDIRRTADLAREAKSPPET